VSADYSEEGYCSHRVKAEVVSFLWLYINPHLSRSGDWFGLVQNDSRQKLCQLLGSSSRELRVCGDVRKEIEVENFKVRQQRRLDLLKEGLDKQLDGNRFVGLKQALEVLKVKVSDGGIVGVFD